MNLTTPTPVLRPAISRRSKLRCLYHALIRHLGRWDGKWTATSYDDGEHIHVSCIACGMRLYTLTSKEILDAQKRQGTEGAVRPEDSRRG